MNEQAKKIWEDRYRNDFQIAKWPFDQIISLVMRRFGSIAEREKVKILDYGCGGGNNFWFLIREGFAGYACDIASSAIDMTRRRIESVEHVKLDDERYVILDGDSLPYPDGYFSAIIDRESLCQSTWDAVKLRVSEFRRILAPEGWYLGMNFTDHHPDISQATHLGGGDYNDFKTGLFKDQGLRHLFSYTDIMELFSDWSIDEITLLSQFSMLNHNGFTGSSEFVVAAQVSNKDKS
ncbi:class I SAM-dependent methyltransferase [Chlorobium phaeovibrioides]|uniref:class I SAM-dependent methyltransferase n=1 Tax=Chlorobium phaeovibrioides TaxID=1094 RepID=UPI000F823F28|nr:class I SAM-dependent methyltransferase [Chlorobium phaeovibrioides]RTY33461.1 class I SAM-dependent methyltransferase [Chlorobium phaeovibrioides]